MRRRSGPTLAASMSHGKVCRPAKFREITGARTTPKHDPDHVLAAALEHAKCKTGLGYHMWAEFIRDFPKARDQYKGAELEGYDARRRGIYRSLKHRDGKYMASFASYLTDDCEAGMRSYAKRRRYDPNARRPRCTNPVLRQGAGSCVIYGRGSGAGCPRRRGSRCWNRHMWCCGSRWFRPGTLLSSGSARMWWRGWRAPYASGR